MSQITIGRKLSDGTKEKLSKVKLGHKVSENTRRKISIANTGRLHTAEWKA